MNGAIMTDASANHWDRFYRSWHFTVPSQFAALVATELQAEHALLELGCGNGRDAVFFAGLGHTVHALDQSEEAINGNRERAQRLGLNRLAFHQAHAGDPGVIAAGLARVTAACPGLPVAVYARFFFHAITGQEERAILMELGRNLPAASRCFFEFRSTRDASTHKVFGDHYRRYVDADAFLALCRDAGLDRVYEVTGQGLAKFRDEDPWVTRVILARPATTA